MSLVRLLAFSDTVAVRSFRMEKIMRRTSSLILCLMACLLGGCFETTQVVTLNPDGSGKVEFTTLFSPPPARADVPRPDMALAAKDALQQMVLHSKGVDAWSSLSHSMAPDGRGKISGVAYFSSFGKLKLGALDGENMTWSKDANGGMMLNLDSRQPEAKAPPSTASEATIQEQVKLQRAEYATGKAVREPIMSKLKLDLTFVLPGTVREEGCFARSDKGLQIVIEGSKLMEAMDKIMADDALLAKAVRNGINPVQESLGGEKFGEAVIGKKGLPRVVVGGEFASLFDYKAEMEKARTGEAEMFLKLDIDPAGKALIGGARGTSRPARPTSRPASGPASRLTSAPAGK